MEESDARRGGCGIVNGGKMAEGCGVKAGGRKVRSDTAGLNRKAEGVLSLVSSCGGAGMGNRGRDSDLGIWFKMPACLNLIPLFFSQLLWLPFPTEKKVTGMCGSM